MSLVLLSLVTLCWSAAHPEPMAQCDSEVGPSPEWLVQHALIPGDLRSLHVDFVKSNAATENQAILMKISWILRADASILSLKATKICVTSHNNFWSYSCVRCNYTEPFQTQTKSSGDKWMFSYIGFPIAPNTRYFIGAHNIPSGKLNGDGPSISVNFTSPGCLDHIMKYQKKCIMDGSLWEPNVTACKKNKTVVEVNFTTSALTKNYMALVKNNSTLGYSLVSEDKLTRASVQIVVTEESEGAEVQFYDVRLWTVPVGPSKAQDIKSFCCSFPGSERQYFNTAELTPYFPTCGSDCIRHRGTVVLCPKTGVASPLESSRSLLGIWLPVLLLTLLMVTWMLILGIYLRWKLGRTRNLSLSATQLLPPLKILVVYPSEICFHHTVCYFADFIQNHCRSEIILEKWQKKKIAEMGPVQWLTTQKKASDRVIFLLSNDAQAECDGTCGKSEGGPGETSQDLFPLAFNLFCSDLRSQACRHKYMVVYFREIDTKENYHALNVCPKYRLMKDATAFCTELLRVKPRVFVGKKLGAHHGSCAL